VKRALLVALVALGCAALPTVAAAEPCPLYDGRGFSQIDGVEGPEEFCWEVSLNEGQELVQIDEQHVGVLSKTGAVAWEVVAPPAHDVEGVEVPTSVAVAGPSAVTVTVHHRDGNPAAGGTPFHYPISAGTGWEAGFATVIADLQTADSPPPPVAEPAPTCLVPSLRHKSLKASRKILLSASCRLGPVHGNRRLGSKVVRQYRPPGTVLPVGTEVGVKLG
jgi:hypothetical protein